MDSEHRLTTPWRMSWVDQSGAIHTTEITGWTYHSGETELITLSKWESVKRFFTPKSRRKSLVRRHGPTLVYHTAEDPEALAKAKRRVEAISGAIEALRE